VPATCDHAADPVEALARALRAAEGSSRGWHDAAGRLAARVAALQPSAAILWLAEEDESSVWHVPAMRRTLAQCGVPSLVMTRRDWSAGDGAAAEIADFLRELAR
jgi:hypothetical protein